MNRTSFIALSSSIILYSIYRYRKYCCDITFNRLNNIFKPKEEWENELRVYSVAMPKFNNNFEKRKKCILLISGYRDIPYVWSDIEQHFIKNKIDYYAPRTFGNGRKYFQYSTPQDWIITYLESIYFLQELYEEIDIVSFSTGSPIALYLTQFTYKCKINNLFLCAPFLSYNKSNLLYYYTFDSSISWILKRIYAFVINYHHKLPNKYGYCRDVEYKLNGENDFYELAGYMQNDIGLFNFIKFRPKIINANNLIILKPNNDTIIGDCHEYKNELEQIYSKNIPLIEIPTFNDICNHVMFKENPEIVKDIFNVINSFN